MHQRLESGLEEAGLLPLMVQLFELRRRDIADRPEEPLVVEPGNDGRHAAQQVDRFLIAFHDHAMLDPGGGFTAEVNFY